MRKAQKSSTQPPAANQRSSSQPASNMRAERRKENWHERNKNEIDRFPHGRFLPEQYALQNATQLRSVLASLQSPKCCEAECTARSGNEQCGCRCCMFASVNVCVCLVSKPKPDHARNPMLGLKLRAVLGLMLRLQQQQPRHQQDRSCNRARRNDADR